MHQLQALNLVFPYSCNSKWRKMNVEGIELLILSLYWEWRREGWLPKNDLSWNEVFVCDFHFWFSLLLSLPLSLPLFEPYPPSLNVFLKLKIVECMFLCWNGQMFLWEWVGVLMFGSAAHIKGMGQRVCVGWLSLMGWVSPKPTIWWHQLFYMQPFFLLFSIIPLLN